MAWYWPEFETPQSAKTAVVNAVGVSALFAVWMLFTALQTLLPPPYPALHQRFARLWVYLSLAVIFAVIGWGIRRMSRAAAIAGALLWLGSTTLRFPAMISAVSRDGSALIGVVLSLGFLLFYVNAVRATLAYHHLKMAPASPTKIT
jgi:hypothetical protein